jgi:hypothetical protein
MSLQSNCWNQDLRLGPCSRESAGEEEEPINIESILNSLDVIDAYMTLYPTNVEAFFGEPPFAHDVRGLQQPHRQQHELDMGRALLEPASPARQTSCDFPAIPRAPGKRRNAECTKREVTSKKRPKVNTELRTEVLLQLAKCPLGCRTECAFVIYTKRQLCERHFANGQPAPGEDKVPCLGFGHRCERCHGVHQVISKKPSEYSQFRFDELGNPLSVDALKSLLERRRSFPRNWYKRCNLAAVV